MACNCFEENKKLVINAMHEKYGKENIAEVKEAEFQNYRFVLSKGDFCNVVIPFVTSIYLKKKDGTKQRNLTNCHADFQMKFCPFCGTKFIGKEI